MGSAENKSFMQDEEAPHGGFKTISVLNQYNISELLT